MPRSHLVSESSRFCNYPLHTILHLWLVVVLGGFTILVKIIVTSRSCSYFAAGTGAAGLVGASLWWVLRGLGVRVGVGLSSVRALITGCSVLFKI